MRQGWFSLIAHSAMKKALLMVGAKDANGDGPVMAGYKWSSSIDGQDGAGAPDMARIKAILDGNRYAWLNLSGSSFSSCGTNCLEYFVTGVTVPADYALRVGLSYYSCAFTDPDSNALLNDFDLWVIQQGGSFFKSIFSSTSLNSEVELIHALAAGASKTYDIKIRIKSGTSFSLCGASSTEPVAVVWDTYYAPMGSN